MTFKPVTKINKNNEVYRADEHKPNLTDFLMILDLRTTGYIYSDLLATDDDRTIRGNKELLVIQAQTVRNICLPKAKSLDFDFIFWGQIEDAPGDPNLEIADLLDNVSIVTLGNIISDLADQDGEWFNDNVSVYKKMVMTAGDKAIKHYLPLWQKEVEKGNGDYIFMNTFEAYKGGLTRKFTVDAETIVGINHERLQHLELPPEFETLK